MLPSFLKTKKITFRQRISFLKAILCLTTAVGVVLVVQPTFIFKEMSLSNDLNLEETNTTTKKLFAVANDVPVKEYQKIAVHQSELMSDEENSNQYIIGVVVGFSCAFSAGLALVLSSKAKRCPNHILMIVVGFCTFLVGILGPLFNLENRFLESMDTWTPSMTGISLTKDLLFTFAASVLSLFGVFVLIYASQVAPPTLVSTIRSCEILFALFVEKVVFGGFVGHEPEGKVQSTAWLILGALLVLCSAIFMTLSDWIEKFLCPSKSFQEFKEATKETINDHTTNYESEAFILPSVQTTITTIGDSEDLKQPLPTIKEILQRL